jgi:hypothetical protein
MKGDAAAARLARLRYVVGMALAFVAVRTTTDCNSYAAWWAEGRNLDGRLPPYGVAAVVSLTAGAYFLANALSSRHARAWTAAVLIFGVPGIWLLCLLDHLSDCRF